MADYEAEGPEEAREIIRSKPACETEQNGTGVRCTCFFDCANYWLRASGFRSDG